MDGEGTRTQLPSNALPFPSSGSGFSSSGWYPGFNSPTLQVLPGRPTRGNAFLLCLYHLPGLYHFLPCVKALYECVLSPRLDCELFAGWDHVLFIFASPTAFNIVSGSQSAPSTRLWDTQMNFRGKGRKWGPLGCRGSVCVDSESQ